MVQLLLEKGAEVDATDKNLETALHAAARKGKAAVIELLLKAGASKAAQSKDGKKPAEVAEAANHAEAAKLLA